VDWAVEPATRFFFRLSLCVVFTDREHDSFRISPRWQKRNSLLHCGLRSWADACEWAWRLPLQFEEADVIWFFTKESERLSYEIRIAFEEDVYELVVRSSSGAFREQFTSEESLLKRRVELERALRALGWRERTGPAASDQGRRRAG
jgi:hypothetical protein